MTWRDAMDEAAAAIESAQSIVAIGHIGPDGDALGSVLALALGARAVGKDAVATYSEPFTLAARYRYLDTSPLVHPDEIADGFDLAIMCDCGTLDRLGTAARHAISARRLVMIDHHLSNDPELGDIRVVDATAAATAQIVHRLFGVLGWQITKPMADAIYTGLVTDTGRFQYSNTSPEVHGIAAELLELGVQPDVVGQHVYEEAPFGYLGVVSDVLGRARLEEDSALVWSVVESDDLERAGITYEEAEGLIDLIRLAEEAQVACLLRRIDDGLVKGSLRSRGRVDVAAIAGALGGGGHHNAAGFTTSLAVEDVVALIRDRL